MNLNQLYYLREIARTKGLTRAAEVLYVTQSSLSHAMRALEEELGITLFYKDGHDILLTPYGLEFLHYAERALRELESGVQLAQSRCSPARGTVRVATVSGLSADFVPRCISSFTSHEENSQITFLLDEKPTKTIVNDFEHHLLDIGFGSYFQDPDYLFYSVRKEKMVAAISKEHPLAHRDVVTLEELSRERLVGYNQDSFTRTLVMSMFRERGLEPNISMEAATDQMLLSFIVMGNMAGIVPQMFGLDLYPVKTIEIEGVECWREFYMFRPKNRDLLPAAQKFWDHVCAGPGKETV